MSAEAKTPNGHVLVWDDATRIFTDYTSAAKTTVASTRAYTPEENALADVNAIGATVAANSASILNAADQALTDLAQVRTDLATLASTANTTINAAPATYIKQLGARLDIVVAILRKVVRYEFNKLDGGS